MTISRSLTRPHDDLVPSGRPQLPNRALALVGSVASAALLGLFVVSGCDSDPRADPEVVQPGVPSYDVRPARERMESVAVDDIVLPAEQQLFFMADRPAVLAARLTSDRVVTTPGRHTVAGITDDGIEIPFDVRWLQVSPEPPDADTQGTGPSWLDDGLRMRECPESQTAYDTTTFPFLVLDDPSVLMKEATVRFGSTTVPVVRLDRSSSDRGPLLDWTEDAGPSLPDGDSPGEAFRRQLLGGTGVERSTFLRQDSLLRTLARSNTGRWLAGLALVDRVSPGVRDEVTATLTRRCLDGLYEFAAWPVNPSRLAELEYRLLEMSSRTGPQLDTNRAMSVLAWAEEHPEIVAWIESDHGDMIRVAIANLDDLDHAMDASFGPRILAAPTRIEATAGRVTRLLIPRPDSNAAARWIDIRDDNDRNVRLPIGLSTVPVTPPGITMPMAFDHWQLDGWLVNRPERAAASRQARATIQQGERGWELFIECDDVTGGRMPTTGATDPDAGETDGALSEMSHWRDVVGIDALTILVGPVDEPLFASTIMPDGRRRLWVDVSNSMVPEIVMAPRTGGGWTARVLIPDGWLNDDQTLDLGFLRAAPGVRRVVCGPRPALPWRMDPGRLRLDLAAWTSFPGG